MELERTMSARGEEAAGEASGSQEQREPEPAPAEPKKRGPGRPRKPQQVSVTFISSTTNTFNIVNWEWTCLTLLDCSINILRVS